MGLGQWEEVKILLNLHCSISNYGGSLSMVDTMPMVETSFPQRQMSLVSVRQRSQTSLGRGQLANSCILVSQLA